MPGALHIWDRVSGEGKAAVSSLEPGSPCQEPWGHWGQVIPCGEAILGSMGC